MANLRSVQDLKSRKNPDQPLVCLTAYTAPMAKILAPHVDLILVGDSLGMVLYGMPDTLGVTVEMMVEHGRAVRHGAPDSIVIVDMPFGSYEQDPETAYKSAATIMKETGCDGVKLEGGNEMSAVISKLTSNGIPVMGHIGLQPQSVIKDGGYKIKGRSEEEMQKLIRDAKSLEDSGAFSFVIEGTVEPVARTITESVSIPTIGIGASAACDGQILVTEDMLGLSGMRKAKFVKPYADLGELASNAISRYASDVRGRVFPEAQYTYESAPPPKK